MKDEHCVALIAAWLLVKYSRDFAKEDERFQEAVDDARLLLRLAKRKPRLPAP